MVYTKYIQWISGSKMKANEEALVNDYRRYTSTRTNVFLMIDNSSSSVKLTAVSHRPSLTQTKPDSRQRYAVLNVLSPIDLEQNEFTMLLTEPKTKLL